MFRYLYHASRLVFGGWWLFSGLMHFLWPHLKPLGDEPAAIAFTEALMASGLFDWIKVIEVVLGVTMLLNRAMPLTVIALVPLNVVIVYWNFVLDTGWAEWIFGALSIVFNAVLAWPWRRYFWPLLVWRGRADYGLATGWPPARDRRPLRPLRRRPARLPSWSARWRAIRIRSRTPRR